MGIPSKHLFSDTENNQATTFDLISHGARLRIIKCLLVNEHMALHTITTELKLAQSSVSAHIKKLKDAGLLDSFESGTSVFYSLNLVKWDSIKWTLELYLEEMNELWR